MARRWLVLTISAAVVLALLAASAYAYAYAPLWSHDAGGGAVLCADGSGATAVWYGDGALLAQRLSRAGDPRSASPVTLVAGLTEPGAWLAVADRATGVIVAWKAAGVTFVQGFDVDGAAAYPPVPVCSDAEVAATRGAGAAAVPLQLAADGESGVYVRLGVTPSAAAGDTLLAHVSGTGVSAAPDPGIAVAAGTVAAMAVDARGQLVVLLGAPGRKAVAVQRYAPTLAADWPRPVSPYNPLVAPAPATTQVPLSLVAGSGVVAAWREGARVKVQRFTLDGERAWLKPVAVAAPGDIRLAGDAFSGCYVADTTGGGLRVRHVSAAGTLLGGGAGAVLDLGLGSPSLGGVAVNAAGDLDVSYADTADPGAAGCARFDYLGRPAGQSPGTAAAAVAADLVGGLYALAGGDAASTLSRIGESGLGITLRPRVTRVTYGRAVPVAGYLSEAGSPLGAARVQVRFTRVGGTTAHVAAATLTNGRGFYDLAVTPAANASWEAAAPDVSGGPATSGRVVIQVAPAITLALAHTGPGAHPVEVFTGAVKPAHAGARVLLQRRADGVWRTLKTARLDDASRFRILWALPTRTATYTLRVVLPTHDDHARGVSPTAVLRVRFGGSPRVLD